MGLVAGPDSTLDVTFWVEGSLTLTRINFLITTNHNYYKHHHQNATI